VCGHLDARICLNVVIGARLIRDTMDNLIAIFPIPDFASEMLWWRVHEAHDFIFVQVG
jgi:hypothetical protein